MRELKFRAYDGKKMIEDVIPASEASIIELFEYEWQETEVKAVEQYTGLKDKNGKEIYEGDIVEYDWDIRNDKSYRVKEKVVFDDMGARVCGYNRIRNCSGVDVIGNIHENADLLEEE